MPDNLNTIQTGSGTNVTVAPDSVASHLFKTVGSPLLFMAIGATLTYLYINKNGGK